MISKRSMLKLIGMAPAAVAIAPAGLPNSLPPASYAGAVNMIGGGGDTGIPYGADHLTHHIARKAAEVAKRKAFMSFAPESVIDDFLELFDVSNQISHYESLKSVSPCARQAMVCEARKRERRKEFVGGDLKQLAHLKALKFFNLMPGGE